VGLALIDTPDARQALAAGARDAASPAVRHFASRAQTVPIVTAMAEELQGENRTLHYYISRAFAYLRDPASLPALEEALKSPRADVRAAARAAIWHIRRTNQPQAAAAPAQK
jgi:hypothetical protein